MSSSKFIRSVLFAAALGSSASCTVSAGEEAKSGYIDSEQGIVKVPYKDHGAYFVTGGDILLNPRNVYKTPEEVPGSQSQQSTATSDRASYWPNGVIPYVIDEDFHEFEKEFIHQVLLDMGKSTPLRLVEDDTAVDRVRIINGDGCYSYLGRVGGEQEISLQADGCLSINTIHHEIMHAAGFFHEQSRNDRDKYINIFWDNIEEDNVYNFYRRTPLQEVASLGPYDFNSVMHYPSDAFSINDRPTILRKDGSQVQPLPVYTASAGDIAGLRSMYGMSRPTEWGQGSFGAGDEIVEVGDFDGDGFDDLFSFDKTNSTVSTVLSSTYYEVGFSSKQVWDNTLCSLDEVCRVGDVDGDGLADIVMLTRDQGPIAGQHKVTVARNTGTGFSQVEVWNTYFGGHGDIVRLADINGDGKQDLVAFHRGSGDVWTAISTGNAFTGRARWQQNFCTGSQICEVGDFNGDGRDDIVGFTGGTSRDVKIALATENTFGQASVWHNNFGPNGYVLKVGDMNADGKDDIVAFRVHPTQSQVWYALSNGVGAMGRAIKTHETFCTPGTNCLVGNFATQGIAGYAVVKGTIHVAN